MRRLAVAGAALLFKATAIVGAIVLGVYVLWNLVYPTNSFRYRLTLEVSVDGKRVVGSGVIEVTVRMQPRIGDSGRTVTSIKGEAVTVDLGARGILFALVTRSGVGSAPSIVYSAFPPPDRHGAGAALPENLRRYQTKALKAELSQKQLPLLVRFRDIRDARTVERVDPNNLAASFGEGVYLVRATIETTRDEVTTGIEKLLSWLPSRRAVPGYLHGTERSRSPEIPNLNGSEFSTGVFW